MFLLKCTPKGKKREQDKKTYVQSSEHFGGLVTLSRPHGKVNTVAPQKHFMSTGRGQG